MKVVIAGDSITEGEIGFSYVKRLEEKYPHLEIVNMGLGGDTLIGISNRLLEYLRHHKDFDAIIIEAGHNDILIPFFEHGEKPYQMVAKSLQTRGSVPVTDMEFFEHQYNNLMKLVKQLTDRPIFITTLSCISEDLNRYTNLKRMHYNEVIRALVDEHQLNLIDIGPVFNEVLEKCVTNNYLLNDFFRAFVFDSKLIKTPEYLRNLSQERKLNLTIDGVHLNEKGAEIYERIIGQSLKDLHLL